MVDGNKPAFLARHFIWDQTIADIELATEEVTKQRMLWRKEEIMGCKEIMHAWKEIAIEHHPVLECLRRMLWSQQEVLGFERVLLARGTGCTAVYPLCCRYQWPQTKRSRRRATDWKGWRGFEFRITFPKRICQSYYHSYHCD